jgi:carbon-monoxide dehydrogenase small subunit
MKCSVTLFVNGTRHILETHPMRRLLDVLREDLELTGTKEGCGEGECGACAVLLDGRLVNSCLLPVLDADAAEIRTVEGISTNGLHPIQKAFVAAGAAQCGICTPGMLMASLALLEKHPKPSMEEIREGLAGNLCRCTGYMRIFEALEKIGAGQ